MRKESEIKQILIDALEFIEREAIIEVIGEHNGENHFTIKTDDNQEFTITIMINN
jgi:hypothetical protein